MVKITDVAKAAGVSPSTVSHVLSGNRPISKATRERVLSIIKKLGYTPNPNARAMKSSVTGIIGFFAADITELFVTEIIRGVESVIVPNRNHLLLVSGAEFDNDPKQAMEFLLSRRIDGAIISYGISMDESDPGFKKLKIPMVFINRDVNESIPCIIPDNYLAGRDVARHLSERRVKRVAIIGGPKNRSASDNRIRGFLDAADELGMNVPEENIRHAPFTFDGGKKEMLQLIDEKREFDGLFCANDYIACGAMAAAGIHDLSIPEELKVIGFDDREFAKFWPTPITTMSQPLYEMGRLSAQYLQDLISGGKEIPRLTTLSSTLILRESSSG